MKIDLLRQYLDEPATAFPWLDESLRLRETATGHGNLRRMAEAGVTLDLLADLCEQFSQAAPNLADAIWLYRGTHDEIVAQVSAPQHGAMPPWAERFDEATRKKLAVYVHSLGGGQ